MLFCINKAITHLFIYNQDYFKRLHECVLTECSQQLREAGLEELFEMETVDLSEETLSSFGDKEFILDRMSSVPSDFQAGISFAGIWCFYFYRGTIDARIIFQEKYLAIQFIGHHLL